MIFAILFQRNFVLLGSVPRRFRCFLFFAIFFSARYGYADTLTSRSALPFFIIDFPIIFRQRFSHFHAMMISLRAFSPLRH